MKPIHILKKRILRLNNLMSPRESSEELLASNQIQIIYDFFIDGLIGSSPKVSRKEITVISPYELSVDNNNDIRGSSLGFYLVPSVKKQVLKNLLTFRGTISLNKLISEGDLPVDSKLSGEQKKYFRKMKSRIVNKDVINKIFTWLGLSKIFWVLQAYVDT